MTSPIDETLARLEAVSTALATDRPYAASTAAEAITALTSMREERDTWFKEAEERADACSILQRQLAEAREVVRQRDDLLIKAEKLRFGPDITVESRGRSLWAVCASGGGVLDVTGEWVLEPQPSSRTEEFIARTRFTFADAVVRARSIIGEA